MYYIYIDGLTNEKILDDILMNFHHFGLEKIMFTAYRLDLQRYKKLNRKFLPQILVIRIDDFEGLSEEETENIILDMIELKTKIILVPSNNENIELQNNALSKMKELGLKFSWNKPFDFDKEIDLGNLSYNEIEIIKELFEEETNRAYNSNMFMLRFNVDSDGKVYNNSKYLFDLNEKPFIHIITYKVDGFEQLVEREIDSSLNNEINVSFNMYDPSPFLIYDDKINEKIINYKIKVFNAIKNISPDDYPRIPKQVIEILNNNEYIPFEDIIKIIAK